MIEQMLFGAAVGLLYATAGYLSKIQMKKVKFDSYKFLKSVLIGAGIGLVGGYYGLTYNDAIADGSIVATATYLVNKLLKIFKLEQ